MKRVAIFLISDGIGGAEQVVWQTINGLGHNGSIYLIVNNEIAGFYENLLPDSRVLNIGDVFLQSKSKYRFIRLLIKNRFFNTIPLVIKLKSKIILDFILKNKVDLIHAHLDYAAFSSLLIKKKKKEIKVFLTVHGASGLTEDKLLKPSLRLSLIDFSSIDKLIFVSQYIHNLYKTKNIQINDYEIIYNGIDQNNDLHSFRSPKINKEFRILYVGGSKYIKGYDILADTVTLLQQSDLKDSFRVVVLGHLSDGCDFIKIIRSRNIEQVFELIGFIPPPLHLCYFRSADVLFMPSRSEALPIAALEAISLNLPVIVNCVGGLPEIVKHGENGFLGDNNPGKYLEHFIELFGSYNKFLEKVILYNIKLKSQFDSANMCQKLTQLYK